MKVNVFLIDNELCECVKCVTLPSKDVINPSILSNLIRDGFGPVEVLYEMLQTEIFSCNFLSNKILLKLIFYHPIISSK